MSARERHPGDRLAALVDGRLAEPDRSRVIDHLTRCPACLSDYDDQLALKGLLGGLGAPGAPDELRARLAELPEHATDLGAAAERHGLLHALGRRGTAAAATAVSVLALGGVAYAVGGGPQGSAVVPPADQYLREHAAVSVRVPLTEPVLQQLVPQQVPLITQATAAPVLQRTLPPAASR
jgi:anti-sigma factor RsiW